MYRYLAVAFLVSGSLKTTSCTPYPSKQLCPTDWIIAQCSLKLNLQVFIRLAPVDQFWIVVRLSVVQLLQRLSQLQVTFKTFSPCLRLFCCLENNYCVVRSFRPDRTVLRNLIALVNAVWSSIGRRRGPQVALALLFLQARVQFLAFVSISNVKSLGVALRMLFPRLWFAPILEHFLTKKQSPI